MAARSAFEEIRGSMLTRTRGVLVLQAAMGKCEKAVVDGRAAHEVHCNHGVSRLHDSMAYRYMNRQPAAAS